VEICVFLRNLGYRHVAERLLGGEKRSQGVGNLGVPRDEFPAIHRLAAIDPFEILA
jgi:hypothetical protein